MAVSDWSGASLSWVEELAALKERIGGCFAVLNRADRSGCFSKV